MYNNHMYRYNVTKRSPVSLWMLDDDVPFFDHTGRGAEGGMSAGVPTTSVPLVAGAAYSSVFKSGVVGRLPTNLFRLGKEAQTFVLEAWILPIPKTTTGNQKILSHGGNQWDGLSINGKVVRFGTEYVTAPDAYCDYDLGEYRLAHVVGIHTPDSNQLWVNGEHVASVVLTEEQKADSYDFTDNGYLYVGHPQGLTDSELAVNAVAVYPSLSGEQIQLNYLAGIASMEQDRVYSQYGGVPFDLDASTGAVFLEQEWVDRNDFETGVRNNVSYAEDQIEPSYVGGLSATGNWITSVPLDAMGDTNIYGVMLSWSGNQVDVETSLDGSTWTPAVSGKLITNIAAGFDPTGKDLDIRVSFDGGLADDPAFLESLRVIGFRNNTVNNISNRGVTVSHPAVLRRNFEPNLYRDDNGVSLNGGTLTIGTDNSTDPDVARTLELWIKPLSGAPVLSVGGTKYRNGVTDTTLPVGEWSLIHYVAAADITTEITVTGDAIIGQATLYPTALSATEVSHIFKSYTGSAVLRFSDPDDIVVSEPAVPVNIYAHNWSIDAAG